MKVWEAWKALENGEKIRMSSWDKKAYIHVVNGQIVNYNGTACSVCVPRLGDTKWQIYEELPENFAWALEQIKAGKKVRRTSWVVCAYFAKNVNRPLYSEDILAKDWVLYRGDDE